MNSIKKIMLTVSLLLVTLTATFAQRYRTADVAVAFGKGFAPALSFNQYYGKKFKYGFGVRLTVFNAGKTEFVTAPAKLTVGKESLAAFFESQKINSQIDTFSLSKIQSNALNLSLNLQYSISRKFDVGFSIDAVGFSFGTKQSGILTSKQSDTQGKSNNNKTFSSSPTSLNLLLIGDSDLGNLNSELYARYWLNDKFAIRGGLGFQFIEYTTTQKVAFDNGRFRSKFLQPMLAVSYKF